MKASIQKADVVSFDAGVSEGEASGFRMISQYRTIFAPIPEKQFPRETRSYRFISEPGSTKITRTVVTGSGHVEEHVLVRIDHIYPISLFGDDFLFTKDEGGYSIFHPKWSLMGEGATLSDAKQDLLRAIRFIRQQLKESKAEELDQGATELRDYLLYSLNV